MTTKSRIDEDRLFGGVARIAYPIEEAAMIAGVARTRMFEAVRAKKITARKAGRATIIEHDELVAYVRSLPTVGKQFLAIALIGAWIGLQFGAAIEMMASPLPNLALVSVENDHDATVQFLSVSWLAEAARPMPHRT